MNDTWNESGMTSNNGSPNHSYADCEITDKGLSAVYIGQVAVNNIQRYYDIDVSSFVNSNMYDKTVSFALMDIGENSKNLNFNSKEAVSNRPELIITDTN